jgi:Ca-activated chloride channel family protein
MIVLFIVVRRWQRQSLKRYGDWEVYHSLASQISFARKGWKFFFLVMAFAFLIAGIVNPMIGSRLKEAERKGIDIILAVDVSNSMNARDIQPSRIARARQAISKLIDQLSGDRIGIIVFAGKAYTQLPVTTDYSAAKLFLSTIQTDMVPAQGTSIGNAIELAMKSFKDGEQSKAIIIITDGENHEDEALKMAKKAAEQGITVHTIGMGLPRGAPIPLPEGGFKKDRQGNTVITKLNDKLLSEIAATGHGMYVRANNAQAGLKMIFQELDKLEKQKIESKTYSDYEDRFQYFLAVAILLLVIEIMMADRKSHLSEKLKLFETKES